MTKKTRVENGSLYKIIAVIHSENPYDYNVSLSHSDMMGELEGSLATVFEELGKRYNDKQIAWLIANGKWSISIK